MTLLHQVKHRLSHICIHPPNYMLSSMKTQQDSLHLNVKWIIKSLYSSDNHPNTTPVYITFYLDSNCLPMDNCGNHGDCSKPTFTIPLMVIDPNYNQHDTYTVLHSIHIHTSLCVQVDGDTGVYQLHWWACSTLHNAEGCTCISFEQAPCHTDIRH